MTTTEQEHVVNHSEYHLELMRQRQSAVRRTPGTEHLIDNRSHPPSRGRGHVRPLLALVLARLARRVDGETARRAVA